MSSFHRLKRPSKLRSQSSILLIFLRKKWIIKADNSWNQVLILEHYQRKEGKVMDSLGKVIFGFVVLPVSLAFAGCSSTDKKPEAQPALANAAARNSHIHATDTP